MKRLLGVAALSIAVFGATDAHATNYRFCLATLKTSDTRAGTVVRVTQPFDASTVPGFEAQFATTIREVYGSRWPSIKTQCSDAFQDAQAAARGRTVFLGRMAAVGITTAPINFNPPITDKISQATTSEFSNSPAGAAGPVVAATDKSSEDESDIPAGYRLYRWCKSPDVEKNVHYYSAVFPADIRNRSETEMRFRAYMQSFYKQKYVDAVRCGDGGTLAEAEKYKQAEEARSIKLNRQVYQTHWRE